MKINPNGWPAKLAAGFILAVFGAWVGSTAVSMRTQKDASVQTGIAVMIAAEHIAEIRRDIGRLEKEAILLREEMPGGVYVERISNIVEQLARLRERVEAIERRNGLGGGEPD